MWRMKSGGGYLFKLEECFYVLKTTLQGQKRNKHIMIWRKAKKYLLPIFSATEKVVNNYGR